MRDVIGGPVAKWSIVNARGLGFDPRSGDYISHAITKDPTCLNEEQRAHVPQ